MAKQFQSELISIKKLTEKADVGYFALYQRQRGLYKKPLPQPWKTKVLNALMKDIIPFVRDLGFEITLRKITPKD